MPKVIDFYERLNKLAPFRASYNWDNTGLLIGDMQAEVQKVLLTLDVTDDIVEYAVKNKANLIISHHPIIFQGIKNITQKKLLRLIEHKIAVICAHTNLDICPHGVNYTLAEALGLQNIQPLSMVTDITQYQIAVYVPLDHADNVMNAMHNAGAGVVRNYYLCATHFEVSGQFLPMENSQPYIGETGKIEKIKEIKLELYCEETHLNQVINAMQKAHPYETPVYTVIPLKQNSPNFALGCYGLLNAELTLLDFAHLVKDKLGAPSVKLWLADASEDTKVKNIAVCGGSGNSLIGSAKQKADVFVSSDFTYHHFLDAPMPIIDAGHFYTENVVINKIKKVLEGIDGQTHGSAPTLIEIITPQMHDIRKLKTL